METHTDFKVQFIWNLLEIVLNLKNKKKSHWTDFSKLPIRKWKCHIDRKLQESNEFHVNPKRMKAMYLTWILETIMQRTILVKSKKILIKSRNSECYQCIGKQSTLNTERLQYALLHSQKRKVLFFYFFPHIWSI